MRPCGGLAAVLVLAAACGSNDSVERMIEAGGLCVSHGAFAGGRIAGPSVRAVLAGSVGDAAELRFVYAGPTKDSLRLGSGQLRRQVGLKLRAADGCNLIYAMWRFEPGDPQLEVSVKQNPGARSHTECGTSGYRKLRPTISAPIVAPRAGQAYILSARVDGRLLQVRLDDQVVWEGDLGPDAAQMHGPAGLRTDNVALEQVTLTAELGAERRALPASTCRSDVGD